LPYGFCAFLNSSSSHNTLITFGYMLSFIYLSYSMMKLLIETLPDFLTTRIECSGDLARYRMGIEEADTRERKVW
jgi:hypothetical protein